jgi:hypothetical protein
MLNPEIAGRIPLSLRDDIEERVAQLRADPTCFDHLFPEGWDLEGGSAPAVTEPTTEPGPVPHTEPEGE